MQKKRCVVANTFLYRTTPLVLALSAMAVMCSTTYAAQLGHARIVSQQSQPLRVAVPVTQLSQQDIQSFAVSAAPISDWKQAGLIPPVDPATLQFKLVDGARPNVKTIQVSSSQPFSGPVADLLLNVQTASGRQQYQVSILMPVQAGAVAPASGAAVSQNEASAAADSAIAQQGTSAQAIRVRRGDTMFSIARSHAMPQVSVYQMMVALQRANPQAFIKGNINLVKAGARLQMPDMAQLTAVSDREARRIFLRQTQEFEQYRQGLAGRKGQAVTGDSAAKGRLSTEAPAAGSAQNASQAQDKVVLSSGSAADKAADERTATGKNLADSQERVSQLEQNVKNLNQALQGQGQAAKDAVVDGANDLGQTISDAASSLSGSSSGAAGTDAATGSATDAKPASAPGSTASASSGAPGSLAASAASAAGQPAPAGGPAATTVAPGAAASAQAGSKGAAGASDTSKNTVNNASNKAGQSVSWFQEHLLGVVTALLALAVLIIAWVLRRANAARDDDDPASPITEAMVQEQLDKINLDLREPPVTPTK